MDMQEQEVRAKRAALYYPTIAVPTGPWLRQALLYWDEIASIVPQRWDENALIPYTPDIDYLKSVGEFRPIRPETLIRDGRWSLVEQLEGEFRSIVESQEFRSRLGPRDNWIVDSTIHRDKLSDSLFDYLARRGLAKHSEDDELRWQWFLFERTTALLYMALLAKYLADVDTQSTIPSTDREAYRDLVYLAKVDTSGFGCAEILCKNILPVPREGVSLPDIVDFKHRRRTELLRFRTLVDQLEVDLASAQSKAEARDIGVRFAESVERGVAELTQVLEDGGIAATFRSLKSLVSVKSPTFWSAAAVLAGEATRIADIPVGWSIAGLGIMSAIEIGCQVVDRRNERRARLRDSAFSYLYYAESLA